MRNESIKKDGSRKVLCIEDSHRKMSKRERVDK